MKKYDIVIAVSCFTVIYLLACFVQYDLNPYNWGNEIRMFVVFFGSIATLIGFAINHNNNL